MTPCTASIDLKLIKVWSSSKKHPIGCDLCKKTVRLQKSANPNVFFELLRFQAVQYVKQSSTRIPTPFKVANASIYSNFQKRGKKAKTKARRKYVFQVIDSEANELKSEDKIVICHLSPALFGHGHDQG